MLGRGVCVHLATVLLLLLFGLIACFQNGTLKSNVTILPSELYLTTPRTDSKDNEFEVKRAGTPAVNDTEQKVCDGQKEKSDTGHITIPGE